MMLTRSVLHQFLLPKTLEFWSGCDVVGIDEAQFFDDEIIAICNDEA
jgi:thymidine kinase